MSKDAGPNLTLREPCLPPMADGVGETRIHKTTMFRWILARMNAAGGTLVRLNARQLGNATTADENAAAVAEFLQLWLDPDRVAHFPLCEQ